MGDELPTEFRLFVAGWNDTENGRYLFDAEAAASCMAAYEKWGVDIAIDLDHQMLDPFPSADPTARDARGWCKLELRDDGSLWAVAVKWTNDGAARLSEKRQRYVSPAFSYEEKSRRVTKIVNVAITALPATHETPPLVAASARARDLRTLSTGPSLFDVSSAIGKALAERYPAPDGACSLGPYVVDVFDATAVFDHEGKLYEVAYQFDGSTVTLGDSVVEVKRTYSPATAAAANRSRTAKLAAGGTMDPKLVKEAVDVLESGDAAKALEILKGLLIAAAGGDAGGDPAVTDDAAANATPEADAEKEEMMAAARAVITLTGKPTAAEAVTEVERLKKLAVDLDAAKEKVEADRAKLEASERKQLVGELVKLHAETPATAWVETVVDGKTVQVPCDRLAKEPIDGLRDRVGKLRAAAPKTAPANPPARPPGVGAPPAAATNAGELSESELAMCKRRGIDPEKYAETRARIRANSTHV